MAGPNFKKTIKILSLAVVLPLAALVLYYAYDGKSGVAGNWKGKFTYLSGNVEHHADADLTVQETDKRYTGVLTLVETPGEIEICEKFDVAIALKEKLIRAEGHTEDLKSHIVFTGTVGPNGMHGNVKRFHQTFFFDTIAREGTMKLSR
jgi:hypothetical protein